MSRTIAELRDAYREGKAEVGQDLQECMSRIRLRGADGVWISRLSDEELGARLASLEAREDKAGLPLRGVTFAIKDNIDLAGLPTTAACPDYAYAPERSAFVVERLLNAGALPLGKTNLDQFATGLVGVRTPYGVARNPYNAEYLPGGSSSGSAVAVAAGLCTFALGTDTAGSGRVPAAFNNLVGLKPTRGLLSTRGVVPACRSLDCVSIFTRTVADAAEVLAVAAAHDPQDPLSRPAMPPVSFTPEVPRLGIPRADQLEFCGDESASALYAKAVARWRELGATVVEVDIGAFLAAARLLYEGPWVAERYAAIKEFLQRKPEALHPVTRGIIEPASALSAVGCFEAAYKLEALRAESARVFGTIDALLLPTTPTVHTVGEALADPVGLNSRLGTYTNFMNLLDLCGLALPAGFLGKGMPWGVSLAAPAFHDDRLLHWGAIFLGEGKPRQALSASGSRVELVVCGAHLSGLPLNWQLTSLGGQLVRSLKTKPAYRLFALPGTTPPKPGLSRVTETGHAIEVEVWSLPSAAFGYFVSQIPAPLGIGRILLEDDTSPQGFLCETAGLAGAQDISELGGWRAFVGR